MTSPIPMHSSAHRGRPAPAELGQNEAKLEHCGEEKLRQLGGGSSRSAQRRHTPKLGQKRAKQEAASDAALRGLSRDGANS